MATETFIRRKTASPASLLLVILGHAAALTALALVKPDIFEPIRPTRTKVTLLPIPEDPPPVPTPPVERRRTSPRSIPDSLPSPIDQPDTVGDRPVPAIPDAGPIGDGLPEPRADPPAPPVRIEAQFDARFAADIQPPYPPAEQRAEREGTVRVRVTVGADGRVRRIERVSATSDAFWRVTERHALARWRFRPATLDGRPVESSKLLNLYFRITD